MKLLRFAIAGSVIALALMFWKLMEPMAAPEAPPVPAQGFAIRDVRVFDGERFVERTTVLVRDGHIAAVGEGMDIPDGVEVVSGNGRTLLPGFIDGHVHTWGDARRDALRFGVTTVLDMFSDTAQLAGARAERSAGTQHAQADLWGAGTLATAPGGHGTQFGMAIPTLSGPGDADGWVQARQAEGSDFIKLVREDLHVYSSESHLPSLDAATAAAVISAARQRGLRAVVHASAQDAARESLRDGADGLVHVFQDAVADDALVALASERGAFVVPTLSVIAGFSGRASELAEDPRLRPWLSDGQRQTLAARMTAGPGNPRLLENSLASVRRLHAAGVRLIAGTDAPNPGTAHGVSMHDEIVWLATAGLAPEAALAAATSAPADAFGLADRGRIAVGLRADLVLVEGNPAADLAATRAIARIWKNGRLVDRRIDVRAAPGIEPGLVSHFDGERLDSRLGSGWMPTSDRMAGGQSEASIARVPGGADGSAGAMRVSGEVRAGAANVWAGAFLNLGDQMMQAVDASGVEGLAFQLRGDGRDINVLVFSGGQGAPPSVRVVATGPEWTPVRLALADFPGVDATQLRAIAITAGEPAGGFSFDLDAFEIR
jgi:imidazolonepropionase-like amidohydrolase